MNRKIILSFTNVFLFLSLCYAQDNTFYNKKDSWIETLVSSRETFIKQQEEINSKFKLILGEWYSVGFFKSKQGESFEDKFPPEENSDLSIKYYEGKYYMERTTNMERWHY